MSNKMLIDATHPEETRVVVLRGSRVEEFDFEAADRQQLRGNIYLAKVTRVEPSLQAAFVDYGGNRHGFLAFSEIHPDYYQIPYADRQALLQEHAREEEEEAAEEDAADRAAAERGEAGQPSSERAAAAESFGSDEVSEPAEPESAGSFDPSDSGWQAEVGGEPEIAAADAVREDGSKTNRGTEIGEAGADAPAGDRADDEPDEPGNGEPAERQGPLETSDPDQADLEKSGEDPGADGRRGPGPEEVEPHGPEQVESVGAVDALEELPQRRKPRPRQYKIQEVIKRRQVLLVQVVKEERGNKGAALTTYLSLAGRYSVLMPNTGRGGGISRKITNPADRKRLKEIATDLDVPEGMGVILRTAGANRTKTEVKRDFEYLLRLWENVRELTLKSTAPKLVYEEGSLIKRSIRDLYSREIDQVVVAGDDAYREAKDFMRMLMPSHARNVQQYREETPIFSRNGVEAQLDAMFSPQVTLKSGGYIVINQTEALVSIDVNSGRSTREHNIEDTALNTNLEAAEEISRQLRLRDLAGLIVIDFIDMEENRNNRSVERKLKDCLRADRARIQVGRISHFGLMEMSRQRIRTGVLESSTVLCPHCRGTGQVRSISSMSLQILRALEDNLLRHGAHHLYVRTRPEVALYVLNQKRRNLALLEDRFGLTITVIADTPAEGAGFIVERGAPVEPRPERVGPIAMTPPPEEEPILEEDEADLEPAEARAEEAGAEDAAGSEGRERKRRRRRRRGNGEDRQERSLEAGGSDDIQDAPEPDGEEDDGEAAGAAEARRPGGEDEIGQDGRRRRRGRRGGRRRARGRENGEAAGDEGAAAEDPAGDQFPAETEFAPADRSEQEFDMEPEQQEQPGYAAAELPFEPAYPISEALPGASDGPRGDWQVEDADVPTRQTGDGAEPASDLEATREREPQGQSALEPEASPEPTAAEPTREREVVGAQVMERPEPVEDTRPKRSGWWNRKSFF